MNTKINTAAVTAEIDNDGTKTVVSVELPAIRGFGWHITLSSTGVYVDYAAESDDEPDATDVITEDDAQTAWYVSTLSADPERIIMHVLDIVVDRLCPYDDF